MPAVVEKRSPRAEALQLLGLARRAGTVVLGLPRTRAALRSGEAALVVVAEDASSAQLNKIEGILKARAVPRTSLGSRLAIGAALGGPPLSAAAVTDARLAQRILSCLSEERPEES